VLVERNSLRLAAPDHLMEVAEGVVYINGE
jgi:hypothetical protein